MFRAFAGGACLFLLSACAPPEIEVHAVFIAGRLAFVAADQDQADSRLCWKDAAVVDDRLQTVWEFTAPGTGECGRILPLHYGRAPAGATTTAGPGRLEPGRLYILIGDATASVDGAFSFIRAGDRVRAHNVDPDSPSATAVREAWWRARQKPAPGR